MAIRVLILAGWLAANPASALTLTPLDLGEAGPAAQPSVVLAPGGEWLLSWQARTEPGCVALRLRTLARDGTLGPVRTAAQGCNWFVNWADFPSAVVADNGDWLTYWLQKTGEGTYAYAVMTRRSTDRGASWSEPQRLHDDDSQTEHGFVALAPAGADRVQAIWLDGRAMAKPAADGHDHDHGSHDEHAGHDHHGTMRLLSRVLGRKSRGPEEVLDEDVCTCCTTDLLRRGSEHLAVWRGRDPGEIRDIHWAQHAGESWTNRGRVHADDWQMPACPVNGPALAAQGKSVLVAWPTGAGGEGLRLKAQRLDQADAAPVLIEAGEQLLGRVDAIGWGRRQWLLSWLGAAGEGRAALKLAVYDADLKRSTTTVVTELPAGRNLGMPRLAGRGRDAVLVWTEADGAGGTRLKAVRIRG